jgi:minor histocompatibility antigen H13
VLEWVSLYIFSPLLILLLALLYVAYRHWMLNNIFAIYLSVVSIKFGSIKSFKMIVPILLLLFIYDMYWVYNTDVMVTVAKNVDLPLKLQLPYLNKIGELEFSMLGLGDIIVPGWFLALCFKYDIDNYIVARRKRGLSQFGMKMYNVGFSAYVLALGLTMLALYVFEHPQPALVFIVPCLVASLAFNSCFGKRLPLWSYSSSAMAKKEENISRI